MLMRLSIVKPHSIQDLQGDYVGGIRPRWSPRVGHLPSLSPVYLLASGNVFVLVCR